MMRPGREQEITQLVQRLIDLLGSDEVAIDVRHTPKLYSRFLADVLAKHRRTKAARELDAGTGTSGDGNVGVNPVNAQSYANFPISEHDTSHLSAAMDVMPNVFPSFQHGAHSAGMGISVPGSALPPAPPNSQSFSFTVHLPPDQTNPYNNPYNDNSLFMDIDQSPCGEPIPRDADMMVASLAQLTDPAFWEHGAMPGFAWTTNPGAWPTAVDAALGNNEYLDPSTNVHGAEVVSPAGVYSPSSSFST